MALERTLTNPYRALDAQQVTAYCVARVELFNADARRCIVVLSAYDGACTKDERANGAIRPFNAYARTEQIDGDLFDQYFSVEAMAGSNLIRQAYLCATRSILDDDGNETNEWAGLPEV